MAVVKSSSSPAAAALLLATLLLFAAASAASEEAAPAAEGCPADINNTIVDAALLRPLSDETLAEFDGLSTREVFDCVCDNIVGALGITNASSGAINRLARDVAERIVRRFSNNFECDPEVE